MSPAGRPKDPIDAKTFAGRVALHTIRLRKARDWDHEQAAAKLGCDRATWFRIERGQTPAAAGKWLDRLAKLFKVDVSELAKPVKTN